MCAKRSIDDGRVTREGFLGRLGRRWIGTPVGGGGHTSGPPSPTICGVRQTAQAKEDHLACRTVACCGSRLELERHRIELELVDVPNCAPYAFENPQGPTGDGGIQYRRVPSLHPLVAGLAFSGEVEEGRISLIPFVVDVAVAAATSGVREDQNVGALGTGRDAALSSTTETSM